jgi:hypothetical protein
MERYRAVGVRPALLFFSLLVPVLLATGGCSASNSSETLSDSISSPFDWSSGSSDSSSDAASAYRQDVSDYTVAFARSSAADAGAGVAGVAGAMDAFRGGLRDLAEKRGVSNWEADDLTLASVGLGLQRAGMSDSEALAFGEQLLGRDATGLRALRAGYASIP